MLISKKMLSLVNGIGKDKNMPFLSQVHITKEGSVVVANGKSIIAIEPLPEDIQTNSPLGLGEEINLPDGFCLSDETASKLFKSIPIDKNFDGLLELVKIEIDEDTEKAKISTHDGVRESKTITNIITAKWLQFRALIRALYSPQKVVAKVAVDLDRLLTTLQVVQKISNDSPLYLEFTDEGDIFFRSIIKTTEQRVAGVITGVQSEYIEHSDFERGLYGDSEKKEKFQKKKFKKR